LYLHLDPDLDSDLLSERTLPSSRTCLVDEGDEGEEGGHRSLLGGGEAEESGCETGRGGGKQTGRQGDVSQVDEVEGWFRKHSRRGERSSSPFSCFSFPFRRRMSTLSEFEHLEAALATSPSTGTATVPASSTYTDAPA